MNTTTRSCAAVSTIISDKVVVMRNQVKKRAAIKARTSQSVTVPQTSCIYALLSSRRKKLLLLCHLRVGVISPCEKRDILGELHRLIFKK